MESLLKHTVNKTNMYSYISLLFRSKGMDIKQIAKEVGVCIGDVYFVI